MLQLRSRLPDNLVLATQPAPALNPVPRGRCSRGPVYGLILKTFNNPLILWSRRDVFPRHHSINPLIPSPKSRIFGQIQNCPLPIPTGIFYLFKMPPILRPSTGSICLSTTQVSGWLRPTLPFQIRDPLSLWLCLLPRLFLVRRIPKVSFPENIVLHGYGF